MSNGVRVRRDVYQLAIWDDTVLWYAKAIADMQKRPLNDPTSWRYQAAIHDYDDAADPLARPDDASPSASERKKFWRQCQHGTWYFLPWHRMYLACFERIVAATIVKLNGPADWALPFWNYSDPANANARRLPPAFREAVMPDGTPNPLRVADRAPGCNTGAVIAGDRSVEVASAMGEDQYTGVSTGGSPGFGGPETGFQHTDGTAGVLERVPHGSMHVAVGGDGWMSMFNTAPLDPIFWLHHCNLDRLWSVWLGLSPQHVNPMKKKWLTSRAFNFHDGAGNPLRMTCAEVVSTEDPPLLYRYEGVPSPGRRAAAEGVIVMQKPVSEMVGASPTPVVLQGQPAQTRLSLSPPSGPARAAVEALGREPEFYLAIENVTGQGRPTPYAVYLNLPPGAQPEEHPDLFVGILPMFGVADASRPGREHAGSGLTYSLKAGEVVQRLKARNAWNPEDLRITFVPWRDSEVPARAAETTHEPITVGRVRVYVT